MIFLVVWSRRLKIKADEYCYDRRMEERSNYLAMLMYVARFVVPVLVFLFAAYYTAEEFAKNISMLNSDKVSAYEKTKLILIILTVVLIVGAIGVAIYFMFNALRSIVVSNAILKKCKADEKPVDTKAIYNDMIERDNQYRQAEADYGEAKRLFFAVDGRIDQKYDIGYRQYNVPQNIEYQWYEELIDKKLDKLMTGDYPTSLKEYFEIIALMKKNSTYKQLNELLNFNSSNRTVLLSVDERIAMLEAYEDLLEYVSETKKMDVAGIAVKFNDVVCVMGNDTMTTDENKLEALRRKALKLIPQSDTKKETVSK